MITARLLERWNDEPITLDRVKQHCVVGHDEDDDILTLYRDTAIEHVENTTRRTLPLSVYRMQMDGFCDEIQLRLPPIRAVTALSYYDSTDTQQVIPTTEFKIKTDYEWARIAPRTSWPAGTDLEMMVVAGYGDYIAKPLALPYTLPMVLGGGQTEKHPLPRPLELAVLMLTAHWYENREPVVVGSMSNIPHSVTTLLFKYRNYKT